MASKSRSNANYSRRMDGGSTGSWSWRNKKSEEERMTKPSNYNGQRVRLILALLSVMIGLALPDYFWRPRVSAQGAIPLATNPSWVTTGNLNLARHSHTTTLLPNGKALVAG